MRTQKSKKRKKRRQAQGFLPEAGRRDKKAVAEDAARHLRMIQHGTHIVELYKKFFPEEFARDGIDYTSFEGLLGSYDRFAELVDNRLFPVHAFSANDMIWEEPIALYTMNICFHSFAPFLWYNRAGRDDPTFPVERLIVSAAGYGGTELRPPDKHRFSSEKLQEISWKQKGIASRLWLAAMALLGGTGNCWLDFNEEEYWQAEEPEWSEGQVVFLAKEFEEAKRIADDVNGYFAWVGHDPERLEQVKRLLRRAQVPEKQPARYAGDPRPFAEALLGVINEQTR
jgi:hypothetical protein